MDETPGINLFHSKTLKPSAKPSYSNAKILFPQVYAKFPARLGILMRCHSLLTPSLLTRFIPRRRLLYNLLVFCAVFVYKNSFREKIDYTIIIVVTGTS